MKNIGVNIEEKKVNFLPSIAKKPNYRVIKSPNKIGQDIYHNGALVARCFKKYDFYNFLDEQGVDWKNIISEKLVLDDALFVIIRETLFIIDIKYQRIGGSVDEELQTCDFKRKQYLKLVSPLGLKVDYVYVLNDWFKKPEYKDVLDYIHSVNCHYKFNELPLTWLGLPLD